MKRMEKDKEKKTKLRHSLHIKEKKRKKETDATD